MQIVQIVMSHGCQFNYLNYVGKGKILVAVVAEDFFNLGNCQQ
jgi:hypothetical protein